MTILTLKLNYLFKILFNIVTPIFIYIYYVLHCSDTFGDRAKETLFLLRGTFQGVTYPPVYVSRILMLCS